MKKGFRHSRESIQKMSNAKLGEKNPFYGKQHSEEHKKRMSKIMKKQAGKNHPMYGRKLPEQSERMSGKNNPFYGKKHSRETREKLSKMQKIRCQDPKHVRKLMSARYTKPNKLESNLYELLQEFLPDEYKYVGNGEFIIERKCPDFININGQKKIIELFGNYWHEKKEEQERRDLFKQYGYETLIIWQDELKNKKDLKRKILKFNNGDYMWI